MSSRSQALSLYRRLLKTGATTFAGDARVAQGWHQTVKSRFLEARNETDAEKLQAAFSEGEEVITILKRNIVQGQKDDGSDRFQLRFRPETELGSNETVKQNRGKQLEMLRNSKGKLGCGGSAAGVGSSSRGSASGSSSPSGSARAFGTLSSRSFSTSLPHSATKETPLVRPVPTFTQTTFLSDGSSIQITTTSPRSLSKLTRDPTNHPLWNPSMEKKLGAGDGDESDRLGRFRRRFGGAMGSAASMSAPAAKAKGGSSAAAKKGGAKGASQAKAAPAASAAESARRRGFDMEDLEWMSGGREAKAGAPVPVKKAAAGKGKKK